MKCKNCGSKFKEDVKFCTVCGAPIEPKDNSHVKWIIISVAATIAVCLIIFFVFSEFNDENNEVSSETTRIATSTTRAATTTTENYAVEPQTVPTQPPQPNTYAYSYDSGHYIIEGSDSRYISRDELHYLSDYDLCLARNEIYARNGRMFDNSDIRNYFLSQSWYNGTIRPQDFTDNMLNDVEKYNIQIILKEERSRN